MGNNKFKLSDMIPNSWFYKLKHMRRKNAKTNDNNINTNNYINQTLKKKLTLSPIITATTAAAAKPIHRPPIAADPPRRSSKRRSTSSSSSCRRRKPVFKPRSRLSVSNSSCAETSSSESDRSLFAAADDDDPLLRLSSSTADIIIDLEAHDGSVLRTAGNNNNRRGGGGGQLSDGGGVDLPPILTRPINFDDTVFAAAKNSRSRAKATATKTTTKNWSSPSSSVGEEKTLSRRKTSQNDTSLVRRSSSSGIRLRASSPRLACARKSVSYARDDSKRCLKESFAVAKSSVDPQRDFRDSMVEMIVVNNIRASKDLEDLLACYLSLNSKQYHDVIVKAFEQIWFDMAHLRL